MAENETIKEQVKVKLFDQDKAILGTELAQVCQEIDDIESAKKASNKEFAATLETLTNKKEDLQHKINRGYDLKEMDCMWIMGTPGSGQKTLVRVDTNEEIRVEAMTQADAQLGMNLQPPSEEEPPADEEASTD
jgi:hypothetical protein